MAASMAGILLQAGTVRVMANESWLLIHQVQFGAIGSFGEVEDRTEWVRRGQDRGVDLFCERASGISKRTFKKKWERKDWWLTSDESIEYGIADRVA